MSPDERLARSQTGASAEELRAELAKRKAAGRLGGGDAALERQRARGKLTARERLDILFDQGSFEELDALVTHRATRFGLSE
ncbi:MAG: carboxyl transferase domain-containing protein, partial [Dehalococcoidia bacterium]